MSERRSSGQHPLFAPTVLITALMLLSRGNTQVDFSKALIWSKYSSTGDPSLTLLYGDPRSYIPDIRAGRNASYYSHYYTWSGGLDLGFGTVEALYPGSLLFYTKTARLQYSSKLISRTGTRSSYLNVAALSNQVTGISVDWLSGLVFWSDAFYRRICMVDMATYAFWLPVVDADLTSPQDVVIYPQQSLLFWSDAGEIPKIERLDLKTNERRSLLSSSVLKRPTKLTVDVAKGLLFWLDAYSATIGSMNFNGSRISQWTSSAFATISSFTIYQDYLFLGSNCASEVHVFSRSRREYLTNITRDGGQEGVIDMAMYSEYRNPLPNSPCMVRKGGCDHFCIRLSSTRRRCQCATGFNLASNGIRCVTRPLRAKRFLLATDERQLKIFQVDVETGDARALWINQYFIGEYSALTFDPLTMYIYWYDKSSLIMGRAALNGTVVLSLPNVTSPLGSDITSLAFDSENQLLFYVDYLVGTISVMFLSNLSTSTVFAQPGCRPRTIALDTNNRWLYWSDCGRNVIERGSIRNPKHNRTSIISSLNACAMTLTIDFQSGVMFWADADGLIETASLDGTGRSVLYEDVNSRFTGLAFDARFVYIADSKKLHIQKLDRSTKQLSNLTKNLFTQPYAIVYYSADAMPTGTNWLNVSAFSSNAFLPTVSQTSTDSKQLDSVHSFSSSVPPAAITAASKEGSGAAVRNGAASNFVSLMASVVVVLVVVVVVTVAVAVTVKRRRTTSSRRNDNSSTTGDSRNYEPPVDTVRYCRLSPPQLFANESYTINDTAQDLQGPTEDRVPSLRSNNFPSKKSIGNKSNRLLTISDSDNFT